MRAILGSIGGRRLVVAFVSAMFAGSAFCAAAEPVADGLPWAKLSAVQQHVLAPLSKDWQELTPDGKQKWLEIASRFPAMPADQQARMQQRMSEWARMSPQQRGQARLNFQQAQQVPSQDRQVRWEAYKALPQERKEELAHQAAKPASAPSTSQATASRALRHAPLNAQAPKSNRVEQGSAAPQAPRSVTPTVVQTGPGATTSLMATLPRPPQHQQVGQPKIDAGPNVVDRRTLLPKKGPQAAAAFPPASAASPVALR